MIINKSRIYTFTVVAFLLYLFLEFMVDDAPFGGPFFGDNFAKTLDGSWIRWICLIAIPVLGFWQASQIGDREIDITPHSIDSTPGQVDDPAFWKALTGNTWLAVLWLPLRFVLAIHWLQGGWHKIFDAGWAQSGTVTKMVDGAATEVHMARGDSLKGFLMGAYTPNPDTGATKAVFGWYADFLQFIVDHGWTTWFGPLIAFGETLVGLGLLFGALLGIAAFFGTVMNMNFMLAGTVSSNPWMFALTVFIIIGWKVAGWLGMDRWLLPALGTPWTSDEGAGKASPKNS
ncbi:MAG: hypothetical protein KC435_11920 [Thermomicrobiales bacterium]|nr:hypothetical protein [Thermomicrobiales bacterium]